MAEPKDPFDLERFLKAQSETFQQALAEIKRGAKTSHWMWWTFPQVEGLGRSPTSIRYSIKSIDEARAFLKHPVLGVRLIEMANAVLASNAATTENIFGHTDDQKLRSSMTLFETISPSSGSVFSTILDKYYRGKRDPYTLEFLNRMNPK